MTRPKETYPDRKELTSEEQNNYSSYLKTVYGEYLQVHRKASHKNTYSDKMNKTLDEYLKTKDVILGVFLSQELLNYRQNDLEKLKNTHLVISRIAYDAKKSLEVKYDEKLFEKTTKLLLSIDYEYQFYYRDCYSHLAKMAKDRNNYQLAVDLYSILEDIENNHPTKTIVPARYLLTFCYINWQGQGLSPYDLDAIYNFLEEYTLDGFDDYYHLANVIKETLKHDSCPFTGDHISLLTSVTSK